MTKLAFTTMLGFFLGMIFILKPALGQKTESISDFTLLDESENETKLSAYSDKKAVIVVFTSSHCSWATKYVDRLAELHEKYSEQDIAILAINSNDADMNELDKPNLMRKITVFPFPYLKDTDQEVAKLFKATKNPEAFLLVPDAKGFDIVYQGKIDDNPLDAKLVRHPYLEDALSAVIEGKTPEKSYNEASGCNIKWKE